MIRRWRLILVRKQIKIIGCSRYCKVSSSFGAMEFVKNVYWKMLSNYREISNISRTKSPILHGSRLVVQLSFPDRMEPGV